MQSRADEHNNIRCGKCGHILFKLVKGIGKDSPSPIIEIKCHSCKAINEWGARPRKSPIKRF